MKHELSDADLNTYARQVVLADIGYDGQLKLRNATACIIGLGGLGSQIAPRLVGMGIGQLRIVDRDIVSRSDLHRQNLYDVDAIGAPKVEVAVHKLSRLNPDVELVPYPETFNATNAEAILKGVDVVLDGLDRPEPRYIVNWMSNKLKIPYVFGAAIEAYGNVSTLVPGQTFCIECFMPGLTEDDLPKCGVVGVHPSVLGIITSVQVSEAVRLITGQEPKLLNKLLYVDLREMAFETLNLSADESCKMCGIDSDLSVQPIADTFIEETCARDGQRNFVISPKKRIDLSLENLKELLTTKSYPVKISGKLGITFDQSPDVTICILKSGVMIAQIPPRLEAHSKDDILNIYKSIIVDGLGLPSSILP
ncbi:MAG TPA: HesA/MoeB/ThiF family protein [Deltaproteobacteria bacterium]|nr:HesA/MoeB/ThiF family protein [Deltaproteobacteria bacterium]